MIYLIDGHNLIPKIPGLSLNMIDDELKLVQLLQPFARIRRSTVEVYFDQAPPGYSGTRRFGMVTAHFVRKGTTADQEIISRLHRMKKSARTLTVITSDRHIRVESLAMQAVVVASEVFAEQLEMAMVEAQAQGSVQPDLIQGAALDEWLKLFGAEEDQSR